MNIIWYIFYPLTLGLIFFTYAFFKWPKYAIASLIIAKPIIDLTWNYNILYDINFLKIYAGLFAILGVIYIIYKRINVLQHPISLVWLVFIFLNFVSTFIISDSALFVNKIDYILRILNGFVALILFAYLFDFKKDTKFVLSVFIVAGIVPILFWLITVLSGNPIVSNDELRRIIGPYHRFWQFNFYAMQTIICCLAYLALSSQPGVEPVCVHRTGRPLGSSKSASSSGIEPSAAFLRSLRLHFCAFAVAFQRFLRSMFSSASFAVFLRSLRLHFSVSPFRMMAFIMLFVSVVMVYTCYSKSGWITLITILLIWFVLRKKYILSSLIPIIVAVIIFVNPFATHFQKTFQNEVDYFIHDSDTKEMVFRGRMIRWENGMQDFSALPTFNKLFGSKETIGYPENYYLRVLWNNGIIGFMIYMTLLAIIGYFLIKRYIKHKNPIVLGSILVWIFYLLNSIGSYPMLNPAFQWFMWGMIGFILTLHKNREGHDLPSR